MKDIEPSKQKLTSPPSFVAALMAERVPLLRVLPSTCSPTTKVDANLTFTIDNLLETEQNCLMNKNETINSA